MLLWYVYLSVLCNWIKFRQVLMFLLSALFHNMFRPNWPSSGVQGAFQESVLLSFWSNRLFKMFHWGYVTACLGVRFICNTHQVILVLLFYTVGTVCYFCLPVVVFVLLLTFVEYVASRVRVRVRVTLRLAVYRQSVRLGDKPLETHD
jgi:hypothetical protein